MVRVLRVEGRAVTVVAARNVVQTRQRAVLPSFVNPNRAKPEVAEADRRGRRRGRRRGCQCRIQCNSEWVGSLLRKRVNGCPDRRPVDRRLVVLASWWR